MSDATDLELRLERARALVRHLEAGDLEAADAVTRELTNLHESALFLELGRLTRELHEAINGFLLDERLQRLVRQEIPDATERLEYVITMTEQAANTTLTAVEQSIPLVDDLQQRAGRLAVEWQRFRERQLKVGDFRDLAGELGDFLAAVQEDGAKLHGKLSEMLLAQDFQDLTGQIIRKVITLVQDVEEKLVQIIRISGARLPAAAEPKAGPDTEASGPVVPGVDRGDVVQGQDEVDDLLSSLGF